ncbi:MAG: phage tail protein [Lachnospiraceae bacterium]|nr:phage tail protein [Lachnospiraceae bacterium]
MSVATEAVVTNTAKTKMVKARAGLASLPAIVGMAFGDGAVTGSTIRTPLATDTALQHQLLRQVIDSATLQQDNISVLYACTLAKATLAGENINEIALYDSDGDLVCIKSFSNKGKDSDMEMEFSILDKFSE